MTDRILVTGSRSWSDIHTIERELWSWWFRNGRRDDVELVHGACPYGGADIIAGNFWERQGFPVRRFPADFQGLGRKAGPLRNQAMVDLGGYQFCFAFPLPDSRGTLDCMKRAEDAGIPIKVVPPKGAK